MLLFSYDINYYLCSDKKVNDCIIIGGKDSLQYLVMKNIIGLNMKKCLFYVAIAFVVAMSSCTSYKTSLPYFEDIRDSISGEFAQGDYDIKIIPDDELLITVTSMVPEATAMYNLTLANPAMRDEIVRVTQPQQQTYIVDAKGDIQFPVLGKLHVEGLSTQELTKELTSRISKDVENPIVRVQLVNFRINVLGEVKQPGAISVKKERYTILDALADAGDLTEYGERSNVLLIREVDGKRIFQRMNLNNSALLTSPYFYLQQNDVVYVEPNEIRRENAKYNQNNSYKISVVSTIVSACSVIASLIIALVVK